MMNGQKMNNEISYMKQEKIFNPISQRFKIKIIGVGNIGSWVALALAKCGFNDIEVWDYDKVEMHNIPSQLFRMKDNNMLKVVALKYIIKEYTDVEIKIVSKRLEEKTISELNIELDNIIITCVDSLNERKKIYNLLKNSHILLLDCRMGGEEYNIKVVDLSEEIERLEYEKSLNIEPKELECGERSVVYTNISMASEICNLIKKINNNDNHPTKICRHMKQYLILNDQNKKDSELK